MHMYNPLSNPAPAPGPIPWLLCFYAKTKEIAEQSPITQSRPFATENNLNPWACIKISTVDA